MSDDYWDRQAQRDEARKNRRAVSDATSALRRSQAGVERDGKAFREEHTRLLTEARRFRELAVTERKSAQSEHERRSTEIDNEREALCGLVVEILEHVEERAKKQSHTAKQLKEAHSRL